MDEPSVLDYVKSKIQFWKKSRIEIPSEEEIPRDSSFQRIRTEFGDEKQREELACSEEMITPIEDNLTFSFPWRVICAVIIALIAQRFLEPPDQSKITAITLYIITTIFWIWSLLSDNVINHNSLETVSNVPSTINNFSLSIRKQPFIVSLGFTLLAFISFGNNRFTQINLLFWFTAIFLLIYSLWVSKTKIKSQFQFFSQFFKNTNISIQIKPWTLLVFFVFIIVLFFRLYMLEQVPGEMFSDHAEKLLDVSDILNGKTSIFFERNTGREAFQMYLTALISIILKTGLSFNSLKIGTAFAGLLTLPFVYLLGKESGGKWVGLMAFFLMGIAYWSNVISRVGLRFPLYPLFFAPTLYYLVKGLRTSNRNDFIFSGIALGLGLHGYSPFRFVPVVVVAAIFIYILHERSYQRRRQAIIALCITACIALIIFLPLFRYMMENFEMFNYRAMTRLGQVERAFQAPLWLVFFMNLWKASIMFFWNNGDIWVHSIPNRPALDIITAAFFFLGILYLIVRYIKRRYWLDLFLLISIPLLMMPSILSLAFPDENPSLNRTGGAMIPVFIISATAFVAIFSYLYKISKKSSSKIIISLSGLFLIGCSMSQNYDLIFNQFNTQFMRNAWNTTSLGYDIRAFSDSIGSPETAYVVPYPHWVDTRLVGINAGYPTKDYALSQEYIADTLSENRAKLFLFKPEDVDTMDTLLQLYPAGNLILKQEKFEGKNYYQFYVPPRGNITPESRLESSVK